MTYITTWECLWLVLSIPIHEFGHWLMYKVQGYNANVKIYWWGILVGKNISLIIKSREMIFSLISGIAFGYMFLTIMQVSDYSLAIYFIACAIDFVSLISCIECFGKYGNIEQQEYNKHLMAKMEKEYSIQVKDYIWGKI